MLKYMPKIVDKGLKRLKKFSRKALVLISIIILAIIVGGYLIFWPKAAAYQAIAVERGPIAETVSVTGNTLPINSVSLAFGNSGIVSEVHASVGDTVYKGQTLARLDTSGLEAEVRQAQANLSLKLATDQNTNLNVEQVKKREDVLVSNAYRFLLSDHLEAVPEDLDTALTPPVISGSYNGPEGDYVIHMYPAVGGEAFYISGIESGFTGEVSESAVPLGSLGLYIQFESADASEYGNSVWTVSIPNTRSSVYTTNKNNYVAALSNRDKAILDAEAEISKNSFGSNISEAQIINAQAGVQSAESKIRNSRIVSPIDGVVTEFNAKVGQFAASGSTQVSIISANSFEIDALVSEIDIGKIALGNKVSMTFDAFPNETFTGSLFYIDPAQTSSEGVVGYKIKVAFDKTDPRMKSGLTANLDIETRRKENALILPQYAILQNDEGSFVKKLENGVAKEVKVVIGLQDQNGNAEILSGVEEGDEVLNIGLKQK